MTRNFEQATGVQRRTAELRAGDNGQFCLEGYAATFNSWSKNLGGFREQILSGAFNRSLNAKADVKCLFNHDASKVLGRSTSGTLTLSTDAKGLRFRCQLDKDQQSHRDLYASVKRGDISECSFAFSVPAGGDAWTEGMDPDTNQRCAFRTLKDVDLMDVSAVTNPAYNQTAVGARSRFAIPGSNLDYAIKQLRRAGQLAAKELRRAALRGEMDQTDFASLGGHMQLAHELCEAACAVSGTARDIIEGCDPDDEDCDSDELRSMKQKHAVAHKALDVACDTCAEARLSHAAAAKAVGRSKK
jgi:HK97 family phage prohead protease